MTDAPNVSAATDAALAALTDGGFDYAFIGGLAVILRGHDRYTSDVDALVWDLDDRLDELALLLPKTYFVDPAKGDDSNSCAAPNSAWKTLVRLNAQPLGPGDSVTVAPGILHGSLAPKAIGTKHKPVVIRFAPGRHEFRASGAQALPNFAPNDVVDNVSWYPDLTIRNCSVTMDSCRGFLISTRGKVLVERNSTFANTNMSAILIADDANSWFESGRVRDVTIRGNRFLDCGDPVVSINPENETAKPDEPVHEGIRILDNLFDHGGISARSVKGLVIRGNTFQTNPLPIHTESCSNTSMAGNRVQSGS